MIVGGRRPRGEVRINGAKNAVLPLMAASMLTPEECVVADVPRLRDIEVMIAILRQLGAVVRWGRDEETGDSLLFIRASELVSYEVPEHLMREMRSSVFLMGPLLGRGGRVRVSYPGGCAIGPRPVDFHLKGLAAMGARIEERHGFIRAEAARLHGADIHLDYPSVGATENVMMAAVRAQGTTTITNAAREPEIVDLQTFLGGMGARVKGAGTDTIRVRGVAELGGVRHAVIPDRIEAGTFMALAAATGGDIKLHNVIRAHCEAVCAKLTEAGGEIIEEDGGLRVRAKGRPRAVDCKTLPYPGFPTDCQPQMMALLCRAQGTSVVTETVFTNRFGHVEELRRMGADIRTEGQVAVVTGLPRLSGTDVSASDLRSGAGLVIAGLQAEGPTCIRGVHHLDRGYYRLETRLAALGLDVRRERAG